MSWGEILSAQDSCKTNQLVSYVLLSLIKIDNKYYKYYTVI